MRYRIKETQEYNGPVFQAQCSYWYTLWSWMDLGEPSRYRENCEQLIDRLTWQREHKGVEIFHDYEPKE